jgi:predicted DNA-binding transcriptional regulator AlpA
LAQKLYDSREFSIPQILDMAKMSRPSFYKYVKTDKVQNGAKNNAE